MIEPVDALVRELRRLKGHGLPLSLRDRLAAASRVATSHPTGRTG